MSLGFVLPARRHSPVQALSPQLTATRSAPLFTDRVVFEPTKLMSCLTCTGQSSTQRQKVSTYGYLNTRARGAESVRIALRNVRQFFRYGERTGIPGR